MPTDPRPACPFCKGATYLTLIDGRTISCPCIGGTGKAPEPADVEHKLDCYSLCLACDRGYESAGCTCFDDHKCNCGAAQPKAPEPAPVFTVRREPGPVLTGVDDNAAKPAPPEALAYECPDHPYHPHPGMCMCILPHALCGKEQVAVISRAEAVAWLRSLCRWTRIDKSCAMSRGLVDPCDVCAAADALERGEEGR